MNKNYCWFSKLENVRGYQLQEAEINQYLGPCINQPGYLIRYRGGLGSW